MSKSKFLKIITEDSRFTYYGNNDVITYAINKNSGVEYFINQAKGIVVCLMDNEYGVFRGKSAVCNNDTFNLNTGMKLARLRATLELKKEMFKVQTSALHESKEMIRNMEEHIDRTTLRIKEIKQEIEDIVKE